MYEFMIYTFIYNNGNTKYLKHVCYQSLWMKTIITCPKRLFIHVYLIMYEHELFIKHCRVSY